MAQNKRDNQTRDPRARAGYSRKGCTLMPLGALKQAKTFLIEACQPEVQPTKFVSPSVFTLKDTILSKHLDRTNA